MAVLSGTRLTRTLALLALLAFAPGGARGAPGIDWPMYGFDIAHDGYNPDEAVLSPATVGGLVAKWVFTARGGGGTKGVGQPVIAAHVKIDGTPRDLLLIGSKLGIFYALDANSTAPRGTVVWQRALPYAQNCNDVSAPAQILGTAAVERGDPNGGGTVYTASRGRVFAFQLASGATKPGWPEDGVALPNRASLATDGSIHSGLTLRHGNLYVTTSGGCTDRSPYYGQIALIDTASATVQAQWFSLSGGSEKPTMSGGGIWGAGGVSIDPVVSSGGVYTATGNPLPDDSSNSVPPPLYSEAVVELTPDLHLVRAHDQPLPWRYDNDFGMSPLLFHADGCSGTMIADGKKSGTFAIYQAGLTGRQLFSLVAPTSVVPLIGAAAFDSRTQTLLVANPSERAPFTRGLDALRADADCQFSLAWTTGNDLRGAPIVNQDTFLSSPTAANGVAYFGVGFAGRNAVQPASPYRLYAIAEIAAPGVVPGQVLWQSADLPGPIVTAPTVVNGQVFVTSLDGTVRAFGLP